MSVHVPSVENMVKIAELKKPHGIKGWLWLFSFTDNREDIFTMTPWWMKTAKGLQPITLTNWRKQGSGLIAQFEQIPDRNVAETMQGVTIWASKEHLPQVDEDEYFWSDLIGLTVLLEDGTNLGKITELFETGANDVMVVKATADSTDNEQRLIPWHKKTVVSVDLERQQVVVDWGVDY